MEELYESWFKVWQDVVVPKLLLQPKWYDGDKDLKEDDIVYFQKKDSPLTIKWTIGRVEQLLRSERDQMDRKIQDDLTELQKRIDKLQDEHGQQLEDLPGKQPGEAVADDGEDQPLQGDPLQEDGVVQDQEVGAELDLGQDHGDGQPVGHDGDQPDGGIQPGGLAANTRSKKRRNCCCANHCKLSFHTMGPTSRAFTSTKVFPTA